MSRKCNSQPITNLNDLKRLETGLLHCDAFLGQRDLMIWKLSVMTCLRIPHVVALKQRDVYRQNGKPRTHIRAQSAKCTYLKPCWTILARYRHWLNKYADSEWMFPSFKGAFSGAPKERHLTALRFFMILREVGNKIGLHNLGNLSSVKTGALQVYHQTNNIGLVMYLLHQRDLPRVKKFLGLSDCNRAAMARSLDKVAFY